MGKIKHLFQNTDSHSSYLLFDPKVTMEDIVNLNVSSELKGMLQREYKYRNGNIFLYKFDDKKFNEDLHFMGIK